jgi:hypothetical protein
MNFFAPTSDDREASGGPHGPMIGRQAEIRIRRSSYLALRDVTCIARGDILLLRGRLPSQYLKQVAQEIAAAVNGVRHVHNGIEVIARPDCARSGRRSDRKHSDCVEHNITTTGGEGSFPTGIQGLKGICDHVSSKPKAERDDRHQGAYSTQ